MRKRNKGFLLALPALTGFLLFYVIPFLITIWYSVSFGVGQREYVGSANFQDIFQNEMFLLAVKNTGRFLLISVPFLLVLSLSLAMLLQRAVKGTKFFRMALFYPMIVPIASAVLGVQMIWGETGIVNVLRHLEGAAGVDYLHSPAVFWILCILYWWKFAGYHVLIFFARLQMIPKPYYENAALCGAGKWDTFQLVTLPILAPVVLFNLLLAVMNAFKCYREAFLLGGNYPDDSIYLLQHFMNHNFQNLNYQKISAASVTLFGAVLVVVLIGYGVYRVCERRAEHG